MKTICKQLEAIPLAPVFVDTLLTYYDIDKHFTSQNKWADVLGCLPGIKCGRGGRLHGTNEWWIEFNGTRYGREKLSALTCKGWIDVALFISSADFTEWQEVNSKASQSASPR